MLCLLILNVLYGMVATSQYGQQESLTLEVQPTANCKTGFFYQTLPLIVNESYITNLDHLFNGYNLEYKLQDHDDFAQYITLGSKLKQQKRQIPDSPLVGLKSYHLDKKGNAWGNNFIALTERSQRTFVHYGVLNINSSAPIINNMISVQNNTNTTCFDALLFKEQNLILVDCAVKLPKPNSRGQLLQNLLHYFRISNGSFIKTIKTDMYVNYQNIARRSLLLYQDLISDHKFLLRSYFYNEMQKSYGQNTYIEIFMITDPNDPWIVQIIDRTFLNAKTLSIADVKIYLGQIFILDNKMGIYRVYINTEEDLKFNGFYEAKGFEKFTVFSNNFEDKFQLALANSHIALEIDWTNKEEPHLINKYSLMPDSKVFQIFINTRFLIIKSSSLAEGITYNYTWIMNRGDRTYTKAFKIIKHGTANTFVDFNEEMSYLIVIDDQKLANYVLDDTNMIIQFKHNQELINKINTFRIIATSIEEMNPKVNKTCQIYLNFTLLEDNNKTMWPIGYLPPSKFTSNYPGKVQIRLHEYVFGPNISYKIREVDHDVIPKYKVYQQQSLNIKWNPQSPFVGNLTIKFLLSQTVNYQSSLHDLMHVYAQDNRNVIYFIICFPDHFQQNLECNYTHQQQFEGQINFWVSGFFYNSYSQQQNHILAYTTKKSYNKVRLIDFTQKQQLEDIFLENGFAGNATSIAITNQELYVVLKYVKNIQIYDLELCLEGVCDFKCELNHKKMFQLGIKYFSPIEVHTSLFHPKIIFIKTTDQIIVVDYNAECKPKLLIRINPVQTAQTDFQFKLNEKFMIVTISSLNLIKEYNIERIALGEIRETKHYPKYGYSLPKTYDLDVSDKGNSIYVTMTNEDNQHEVFVYRTGYPAVSALYDVIDLKSSENVLVDTTGFEIDYVSVYANKQLFIFRQYQQPVAEIFNPSISYSFYVDYSNPSSRSNLELINVKIINLPVIIKVNPWLNDIMNTKNLLYSGKDFVNQINDSKWWEGNVLLVEGDCEDCRGDDPVIKVMNHIQHIEEIKLVPGMSEYQWTQDGGSIQAMNSLLNMRSNGTLSQVVKIPLIDNQLCITQAINNRLQYQVSGCITDSNVRLYLTTMISQKGFVFEPFETTATNIFKLEAVNDLIILVDTQQNSYRKKNPGGIYLFGVNTDDQIPTSVIQIEYINGDDIGMEELGDFYINNAELTYLSSIDSYRLYITEMTRGIFTIEFKYNDRANTILIKAINWVKIEGLLSKMDYQLPYDASYQAMAKISSTYDITLKKISDRMLLTTGKFHIIELQIDFGTDGNLQNVQIKRLYTRYSFYEIQNYIKYHNNLFVISQILPDEFYIEGRSRQILTTYSTSENRSFTMNSNLDSIVHDDQDRNKTVDDNITVDDNRTVEERGFLGGFRINDTVLHYFDFNLTYEDNDGHTEPRVGMVLVEYFSNKIQRFSLHQNLSVVTKDIVDTQIIYIDLKNDFSKQKIRILINGRSPFPEWKLITIILFSIIGGILLLVGLYIGAIKIKHKFFGGQAGEEFLQDSLLTGGDRKSFQPLYLQQNEDLIQTKQSKRQSKKLEKQLEKQRKKKQKQQKYQYKQRLRQQKQQKKQRLRQQKQRQRQLIREQKQRQKQKLKLNQNQKQSYKKSEKEKQQKDKFTARQSQREKEKQRQKEKQKELLESKQRQRQAEREQMQQSFPVNSGSRFSKRPGNSISYSESRPEEEEEDNFSRFSQRRNFRGRPDRLNRNNEGSQQTRPPPPSRRRNIAIIEQ